MSKYVQELVEEPTDPAGGASGAKRFFTVRFLAKENSDQFPFTIANELVATAVGQALGLNLPAVLTYRIGDASLAFIQMIDRDPRIAGAAPATRQVLRQYVDDHPEEIHGAIIFDLFVANNDRAFGPERRNLALDSEGRLNLFDQGNACYYRDRPQAGIRAGIDRLKEVEASLSAMFDMNHKENHYFEFLHDWNLVEYWCRRVSILPDYLIEGAVDRIPSYLSRPTADERLGLKNFLLARRSYLFDHIMRWHTALFTGLPKRESHA